jgi:uncharacterized protein (TIGR02453 family)
MLQQATLDFLKKLKKNNNRDWFEKNKENYEAAKKDVEELLTKIIPAIASFDVSVKDLEPKDCLFRIYRDVRFSKDKTPYKTHMGAYISGRGKKSHGPGYYIHIEPGHTFLAGGIWVPPAPELNAIRQEIDYNEDEFNKVLKDRTFTKFFKGMNQGEKLKTVPKGYAKDHPAIELLKLKSYTVSHEVPDKEITSKSFIKYCTSVFKAMKPMNDFLGRAID